MKFVIMFLLKLTYLTIGSSTVSIFDIVLLFCYFSLLCVWLLANENNIVGHALNERYQINVTLALKGLPVDDVEQKRVYDYFDFPERLKTACYLSFDQ